MREVVEGGTSTTGRKIGGGRPRHREEGSRFLTPEVRYWGAQVEGGKMRTLSRPVCTAKLKKAPLLCESSASPVGPGVDTEMRLPSISRGSLKPWAWMTWPQQEKSEEEDTALGIMEGSVRGG